MPLSHPPGHAQCDFGEALVVIGGVERQAHCFVIDLPHSDGCFVKAYPAETTEAFLDGHVSAFASWAECRRDPLRQYQSGGGEDTGGGRRQRTRAFSELQSHYLFQTEAKVKCAFGKRSSSGARASPRYRWKSFSASRKPIFIAPQMYIPPWL